MASQTFINSVFLNSGECFRLIDFNFFQWAIELRVRPVDWDLNLDLDSDLEKEDSDLDLPLWDLTTSLRIAQLNPTQSM